MNRDWQDEDGSTVLWSLGLSVMILMLGALSVDVWQVLAVRAEVSARVDAAVSAGATVIDLEVYRVEGAIELDQEAAEWRARSVLPPQPFADAAGATGEYYDVGTSPTAIHVVGHHTITPVLLRLLAPGAEPIQIVVERRAEARIDG